jgi:hypothetical protein
LAGFFLGPETDFTGPALGLGIVSLLRINLPGERLVADVLDLVDLVGGIDRATHRIVLHEIDVAAHRTPSAQDGSGGESLERPGLGGWSVPADRFARCWAALPNVGAGLRRRNLGAPLLSSIAHLAAAPTLATSALVAGPACRMSNVIVGSSCSAISARSRSSEAMRTANCSAGRCCWLGAIMTRPRGIEGRGQRRWPAPCQALFDFQLARDWLRISARRQAA